MNVPGRFDQQLLLTASRDSDFSAVFMQKPESPFEIPPDGVLAIRFLTELGKDGIRDLSVAFEKTGPTLLSPGDRSVLVYEEMKQAVPLEQIACILEDALLPINALRAQFDITPSSLFSILTAGLEDDRSGNWDDGLQAKWTGAKSEILAFLSLRTLSIERKAWELLEDRPRWVQTLRIFSDVRPVFDDLARTIDANVLVNTLRIRYVDGQHSRIIHLALDPKDLDVLEEQIKRARQKNLLIRERNERDGIPTLLLSSENPKLATDEKEVHDK